MTIQYRIDLEDQTGTVIAIIKNFISLNYTSRIDKKGNYTLSISGYDDTRLLFGDDYLIRVWMKDPAESIPWTNTFTGIHKTYTDSLRENGNRVYTSFGPDSMELIDSSEINYPATSTGAEKTGIASTVMYEYVDENSGANATTANGRQDGHVLPLTNAPDLGEGPTWSGAASWDRLLDTLQKIRQYSINQSDQIDYRVNYLGSYTWEFQAGVIGTDRTAVGLTATSNGLNGAGNAPVIFGPSYGNVETFVKSESRYNESNAITVLGQGSDTTRDRQTEIDTLSAARSTIAKRERIINANNVPDGDTTALTDRALSGLDKYKGRVSISFTPRRGAQILFRDFFLYDFITAEDFDGIRYNKQVSEVSIGVKATETVKIERQKIRFSDI